MNRIEQLIKFIEEDVNDAFSRYALGLEYVKLENTTEAEKCFHFLFINHPLYIGNYFQYAALMQQLGEPTEAKQIYKKGMEITFSIDKKIYSELQNELANLELDL